MFGDEIMETFEESGHLLLDSVNDFILAQKPDILMLVLLQADVDVDFFPCRLTSVTGVLAP